MWLVVVKNAVVTFASTLPLRYHQLLVYGIYYYDHLSTTRVYPAQLAVVCNSHNTRKFPYYYYAIGAPSLISVTTFWASEIQGGYLGQGRRLRHFKQVRILKGVIIDT